MNKAILLLSLLVSFSSQAGQCQLIFSSQERGRIQFMDFDRQSVEVVKLEECVGLGKRNLGRNVRARTLIRDEVRMITSVRYHYSGDGLRSSGSMSKH